MERWGYSRGHGGIQDEESTSWWSNEGFSALSLERIKRPASLWLQVNEPLCCYLLPAAGLARIGYQFGILDPLTCSEKEELGWNYQKCLYSFCVLHLITFDLVQLENVCFNSKFTFSRPLKEVSFLFWGVMCKRNSNFKGLDWKMLTRCGWC